MFLPSNITLQFGDSGDFVAELQRRLAAIDAHPHDGVSGFYDGNTVNSVSGFQSRAGIRADGIAGPETLRRLNGVASGDATTSDDKKEEEEKKLAEEQRMRNQLLLDQRQMNMHTPIMAQEAVQEVTSAAVAVEAAIADHAHAHAPAVDVQQQIQQQNQREMMMQHMHQQVPQPLGPDPLAQALAQPQPQHHPQQHQQTQAQEQQPVRHAAAPAQPHTPTPTQHHAPATPPVAAQEHAPAEQQPKGLVGRAMAKMDAFMQRIAEQIEAKLPPHVLQQVREAGQTMANNGVREAAIPTGPTQAPALGGPGRGQEQASHRG